VQDLIDRGFYTEEEARSANVGHIVTRALGTKAQVEVDTLQHDLEADDVFLLCSDGLSDMVADWQIQEILKEQSGSLEKAAETLISKANRNGGKDNISVILMQISQAET
jgi:protein phosphatase